jgi:hypothetical protein
MLIVHGDQPPVRIAAPPDLRRALEHRTGSVGGRDGAQP